MSSQKGASREPRITHTFQGETRCLGWGGNDLLYICMLQCYCNTRHNCSMEMLIQQYDPLIIESTIGIVLGPCTALHIPFLKHCTLTDKAVGTIWRALSKPPQRRQSPDLRPLWLLVGTSSAIRPELAFSRAEHSLPYSDVTIYIFAILYLSSMLYVYRFLWPLRLGWLLVCCLYKEDYLQIFKRVSFFIARLLRGVGRLGPKTRLTTPVGWPYLHQLTVLSRSATAV